MGASPDDNDNIEVPDTFVCLLVRDLGVDYDSLAREHLGFVASQGNLESL